MGLFDRFKNKPPTVSPDIVAKMNLEELLSKASVDPAYRPFFYQRLLSDQLCALGRPTEPLPVGSHELDSDITVGFYSLPNGEVALFTSEARILDGGVIKEQVPFLTMKGQAILEIIRGNPAVLNPFSELGKELTVQEIEALLEESSRRAVVPMSVRSGTQKILDDPLVGSEELLDALRECFKKTPTVQKAFLSVVNDSRSGLTRKVIGIQIDGTLPPVLQAIAKVLTERLDPKEYVDIVDMSDRGTRTFFKRDQQPFYTRSY